MSPMWYDGRAVLRDLLAASSYRTIAQAVASLTRWTHPKTVAQTEGKNVFLIVRCKSMADRGKDGVLADGSSAMFDDNTGPTDAFLWANGIARGNFQDVQFNHVWQNSGLVERYTSLANPCVTPAFLAKLTDTDAEICAQLRYRAFELYGVWGGDGVAVKPNEYDHLAWADPLPFVPDVEARFRMFMKGKSGRTVSCARRLGWYFSGCLPDPTL